MQNYETLERAKMWLKTSWIVYIFTAVWREFQRFFNALFSYKSDNMLINFVT